MLLHENHKLFGRLADALAGVAAEAEYASDELLIIQRTIYVGGPLLDVYAENRHGQFRAWYTDGHGEPFWKVVTGLDAPPVLRYQIDLLNK